MDYKAVIRCVVVVNRNAHIENSDFRSVLVVNKQLKRFEFFRQSIVIDLITQT